MEDELIERLPAEEAEPKEKPEPLKPVQPKPEPEKPVSLDDIKRQIDAFEKTQTEKDSEIARLREEIKKMREADYSKYMFPSNQVIKFNEIASLTKDDPVMFRNAFLDDPDPFIRSYIREYFGEASNIGNSLRLLGISADNSTYEDSMNRLVAFMKKHPTYDLTDEFPKDCEMAMAELRNFIMMVKKLTTVRIHIVKRSIAMNSMLAYWLHMKLGEDGMIIHPNVAQRLNKVAQKAEDPLEDASEEKDAVDGLMDEPEKEEKKGILETAKEKVTEFLTRPPIEPEEEGEEEEGDEEEEEVVEG